MQVCRLCQNPSGPQQRSRSHLLRGLFWVPSLFLSCGASWVQISPIQSAQTDCEMESLQNIGVWIPAHSLSPAQRRLIITCGHD